jgi:lysophospholipase L1-like esterase
MVKNNVFTQYDRSNWETLWEVPGIKYRANSIFEGMIGQEKMVVKINSHGFRAKEFKIEKPKGIYRIICIGASTTFQGTTNETTYPALLEKILNKKYPNMHFEVLNFGISGSHSDFWVSRFADLFKFQPDMIIQYNAVNDITGLFLSKQNNPCTDKNKLLLLKALHASFLYQKLFPLNPASMDNCFRLTFQNFNRIALEAKSKGVEYVVGTFAAPDYSKADESVKAYLNYHVQTTWGRAKYYSTYYNLLARFNHLLRDYARQVNMNLVYVDTSVTDPDLFTDMCHMNSKGIEKMAYTFAEGVSRIIDKKLSIDPPIHEEKAMLKVIFNYS